MIRVHDRELTDPRCARIPLKPEAADTVRVRRETADPTVLQSVETLVREKACTGFHATHRDYDALRSVILADEAHRLLIDERTLPEHRTTRKLEECRRQNP